MRTRLKNNVIDATSSRIDGGTLENNMPVVGGVVVPDGEGIQAIAIIVNGDQVYLFPPGRVFTVVGGLNAGTYTVDILGSLYNSFPLAPHIAGTTEISVTGIVSSTSAGGTVDGYGIDSNNTFINDVADPVALQDAATKKYVDDQLINVILPLLASVIPPGSVAAWSGIVVSPPEWLACDGSAHDSVADTTLAPLYAEIGTTYGGTGPSNFNVPDFRGRFPLGKSNGSGSNKVNRANAQTLSDVDGDEAISLAISEIPTHTHSGSDSGDGGEHTHTGSTAGNGGHTHKMNAKRINVDPGGSDATCGDFAKTDRSFLSGRVVSQPDHTHPITGISTNGNHFHTLAVNDAGSGAPHENMQPYVTMRYIIKK